MFYFAQLRVDRNGVTVGVDLVRQQEGYFGFVRGVTSKVREVVRTCPDLGSALAEARRLNKLSTDSV